MPQDLPSWVVAGEFSIQPESALRSDEREALATIRETVPGFDERLSELVAALERPPVPRTATTEQPTDETAAGPSTTELPGGSVIEWVGTGGRQPRGVLGLPQLTAADFGGQVPARITYLIVFEVDASGLVQPGSLILRQSSGYTGADLKVRQAVSRWAFDAAPGAPSVTAIATLHIARDEIR